MKTNVWIINHYASNMFNIRGGRHYKFAKYLNEKGYNVTVLCANTIHNTDIEVFSNGKIFNEKHDDSINTSFFYIKTRKYSGNGISRILNMVDFYVNTIKTGKQLADIQGKPDVIYASSVHPLALVAGIKLARYFRIKCVSEVRDLWPESIFAYSNRLKKNSLLAKLLYRGEKWIYLKSDKIIMTWPGGYDYIVEKGWDNDIPKDKVVHISNGVDNDAFNSLIETQIFHDEDLDSIDYIKFIYTGSIRKVNNLGMLLEADAVLEKQGFYKHKILIFGDGDQLENLRRRSKELKLSNIVFKGKIDKNQVPYALHKADFSILHNTSTSLDKYGQSQNKLFEYFAVGHPILMTYSVGHSLIKSNICGIELSNQSPKMIANAIIELCRLDKESYLELSKNCILVAKEYDFAVLTDKLIEVIEEL